MGLSLVAVVFPGLARATVTPAELAARERKREAPLVANLAKLAPEAAVEYEKALEARQRRDWETAERLLEHVHHEVPGFTAATRLLCLVKGRHAKTAALALCREAAGDGSAGSAAALSWALTGFGEMSFDASNTHVEALDLAERAVKSDPDLVLAQRALCMAARAAADPRRMRGCTKKLEEIDTAESAALMWLERGRLLLRAGAPSPEGRAEPDDVVLDESAYCAKRAAGLFDGDAEPRFLLAELAVVRNDMKALDQAVKVLREKAPDDVRTAYYGVIAALAVGDVDGARRLLDRAVALGLDETKRRELEQQVRTAQPVSERWMPILIAVIVLCSAAMGFFYWRRRGHEGSAA